MSDKARQFAVLATAFVQVIINTLIGSGIYDFGLASTQEISDSLPTYFTPAGYTFLVWNVIFIGVIAYAIYQFLPNQTERSVHRAIGNWVIAANIGNGLWPLVWGSGGVQGTPDFEPIFHVLSGVIIIGILFSLAVIFMRLRELQPQLSTQDEWLVQAPYSAFFAWLNIATVANITSILVALDVQPGEAGAYWSALMIAVATVLAAGLIRYSRGMIGTIAFSSVIVWAFIGVAAGNGDKSSLVAIAAVIAIVVVIAVTIYKFISSSGQGELISAHTSA